MTKSKNFEFRGGAGTFFLTSLLALLITVISFGILYPFALVMMQRWKAENTYVNGAQLRFNGSAIGLIGQWVKWFLLCLITFGIYSFWVYPRLNRWIVENTDFAQAQQ